MESRINQETKKREFKIQPEGLPSIWVADENTSVLCARCKPYKECLGFTSLSKEQWKCLDNLIDDINHNSVLSFNNLLRK